jgi:hypothetical protein
MPTPTNPALPTCEAYLTPEQVSAHLNISSRELRRRRHTLTPIHLGARTIRYRVADVLAYQAMLAGDVPARPMAQRRRTGRALARSRGGLS